MLQSFRALFVLLAFEQFLARYDDVAALLVQLDDGDFDGLALHAVEVADGTHIHLRTGQERARAENVDGEAAFDAFDHDCFDRLLVVIGLLNFVPCVNALRLLVREVDVAFLGLALVAHHVDFVAGLYLGLALVIEHFGERQHAFRLGANVDHHVRAVSFSTVPLMTRSAPSASSVSVVKFSSAEAKSSPAGLSSAVCGRVLGYRRAEVACARKARLRLGLCCSVEVGAAAAGSGSVARAVLESEFWAVVSSSKVMPL